MNVHATLTADPAPRDLYDPVPETVARARALAERQLAVLERLAEAGLQVALAVEREAQARVEPSADLAPPPAGGSLQGLAMAYARVARAVRMTALLQSRVLRELEAAERLAAIHEPQAKAQREAARHEASEARKASVEQIVRRVAARQRCDDPSSDNAYASAEALGALVLDVADRLDDHDIYGDVLSRPIGETVARICRDLGLDPDWGGLAQEAWAQTEAAAGDSRSPFAGLSAPSARPAGAAAPPWRRPPSPSMPPRSASRSAGRPSGP